MSETMQTFWKVTALTTSKAGELLIFEHPTAGRQLPAGSVEPGEELEAAVRREILEESGLIAEGPMERLGVLETTLGPEKGVMKKTSHLFDDPECTKQQEVFIRRGVTVKTVERGPTAMRLRYDEIDHNQTPPKLLYTKQGWAPADCVADKMSRALYHVRYDGVTESRWQHAADDHVFTLFWVPLKPRPQLIAGQQEWLDAVYDELVRRTGV
jgi:8-oxo-dGTP pyrophosphatase MutT (NUDIX family)